MSDIHMPSSTQAYNRLRELCKTPRQLMNAWAVLTVLRERSRRSCWVEHALDGAVSPSAVRKALTQLKKAGVATRYSGHGGQWAVGWRVEQRPAESLHRLSFVFRTGHAKRLQRALRQLRALRQEQPEPTPPTTPETGASSRQNPTPSFPTAGQVSAQGALPRGTSGAVLYHGPSQLDPAVTVAVIATGLRSKTSNDKTGDMVQTWILRTDMEPMQAIHSGADAAICGTCPHRGRVENGRNVERSCYVLAFQAPTQVFRAFQRGRYADATDPQAARALVSGRKLRLGSYGDPAAVPTGVWANALQGVTHWTGYTHSAHLAPELRPYVMASADTPEEAAQLQRAGWRTFRVLSAAGEAHSPGEVLCPASAESPAYQRAMAQGKDPASCASCGLCKGASSPARPVAIHAHGTPGARASLNVERTRGRRLALAAGA